MSKRKACEPEDGPLDGAISVLEKSVNAGPDPWDRSLHPNRVRKLADLKNVADNWRKDPQLMRKHVVKELYDFLDRAHHKHNYRKVCAFAAIELGNAHLAHIPFEAIILCASKMRLVPEVTNRLYDTKDLWATNLLSWPETYAPVDPKYIEKDLLQEVVTTFLAKLGVPLPPE